MHQSIPGFSPERQEALAVIESLRSGIPTRLATRLLPDLRPQVTATVTQQLQRLRQGERPQGSLLWGAYGQGKTHTLTCLEHLALDLGLAVSRVALSRSVSLHQLFSFYGRVASVLRVPNSHMAGIPWLMHQAAERFDPLFQDLERFSHPLPAWIFWDALRTSGEEQEVLLGDLSGAARIPVVEWKRLHRKQSGGTVPPLPGTFKVALHADAYFGVLAEALRAAGCSGWVILIDELELIGRLGPAGRLKAYRHLQWLLNWNQTMPFPIYVVGVMATGLQDIWRGSTRAPHKGDQQAMPELARIKLGEEDGAAMQRFFQRALQTQFNPVLPPLSTAAVVALLTEIQALHALAYGWQPDPQRGLEGLVSQMGDQPLRTYIRAVLEVLDLEFIYRDGEVHLPQITGLQDADLSEEEDFFQVGDPE
ncbi:MAG: hypothetical protein OHK0012_00230 [Synechococcales cyanobacterium]